MKKIFFLIIFSIFITNNSLSEIFEMKNCYYKGNDSVWSEKKWLNKSTSTKLLSIDPITGERNNSKERYVDHKDIILSIDTNSQMIFVTTINTEKYLDEGKMMADYFLNTKAGQKEKMEILSSNGGDPDSALSRGFWKSFMNSFQNRQLIEQKEYNLLTFVDSMAIGFDKTTKVDEKIFVDFKEGTFISGLSLNGDKLPQIGGQICNIQIASTGDDASGSSGTAFFISNKGHLLTNNHVVKGCELSKINFKNKDYDAKLIATDKTLDLALLKANIRSSTFFSFSKDGANKLNKIYVAGFPLGKGLSDDLKISSGIVSALKGFEDNSNEIQIDAPINPGNSGGPIINESGELVAIAVSGLAKDQTEGINFGIKSTAAESFLTANNIKPKKSIYSRQLSNDKLLNILEKGTVYTYCD